MPYCNRSAFERTSVVLDADYDSRIAGAGIGLSAIKLLEKNPQATRRTFLKVLGIGGVGTALMTLPSTLRAQTTALNRQNLLKLSYNFFQNDVGVDRRSQLVFERLFIIGDQISRWDNRTQPTLNGFYVQFLIDVARSHAVIDFISSSEATARLNQLLETLLSIQKKYGRKGLLPTWGVVQNGRYTPTVDAYATGDNFNLSIKVFMVLGAFPQSSQVYRKAESFLDNQLEGYKAMYNPSQGLFYGERKNGFISPCYYLDRISNEFSPGVAWAVSYYGIDSNAFDNLGAMVRRNNLRSWNGDGFEMGWHLTTFNEIQIPQFEVAHHNYLHTMLRVSKADGQPGLRSPGDDPNGGYAISGYDELREGGNSSEGVWNHYTLGAYYRLSQAQSIIDQWYENLGKIQGAVSPMGLFDGGRGTVSTGFAFTNTILGIDHLSGIVGQHTKGPDYFEAALDRIGKSASHIEMYQSYAKNKLGDLSRIQAPFAPPP